MGQSFARARQEQDEYHLRRDAQALASGLWSVEVKEAF
jgi:hypothetical protein